MGLSINIRSSNEQIDYEYQNKNESSSLLLNRSFNSFAHGYEGIGKNCEFDQIQKLFDIDLSPFRMFNHAGLESYIAYTEEHLEYDLSEAKTKEEKEKIIKEYEPKLEEAKRKEAEEWKNNWVDMNHLKKIIVELQEKFETQPELLDKIDYKVYSKETFTGNLSQATKKEIKSLKQQLIEIESGQSTEFEKTIAGFKQQSSRQGNIPFDFIAKELKKKITTLPYEKELDYEKK